MCRACLATAAWITVAAVSSGGMTALVVKKVASGRSAESIPTITPSKEDHNG
jgi:hypothetical protein